MLVNVSQKSRGAAFILCFFLGAFGIHRFYLGKPITGLLQLFTLGGFGFWALIDLIRIFCGAFSDGQKKKLANW
jgi:TM2 domain-containing membrane protein YozV